MKKRLHIETSGCCNNNCLFCCDRGPHKNEIRSGRLFQIQNKTPFLTHEGFKKNLKNPVRGCAILFTTGEPTLNPELLNYVALAKKHGYFPIGIQTNGRTLKYRLYCKNLISEGVSEISVSLHGHSAEIHDALTRTPGSFQETIDGLKNVILFKKGVKISVNFTLNKLNITDLFEFIKMIIEIGNIDAIVFNTLILSGNASRFFNQLFVPYARIAEEFKKTINCLSLYNNTSLRLPSISLSPMPVCLMIGYERFLGIFEQPFEIADNRITVLNRDSKQIKVKKCNRCIYFKKCCGLNSAYVEKYGDVEIHPIIIGG